MSLRIKGVVDKFVEELKEALDADIHDMIMKEREMQSYIEERKRKVVYPKLRGRISFGVLGVCWILRFRTATQFKYTIGPLHSNLKIKLSN